MPYYFCGEIRSLARAVHIITALRMRPQHHRDSHIQRGGQLPRTRALRVNKHADIVARRQPEKMLFVLSRIGADHSLGHRGLMLAQNFPPVNRAMPAECGLEALHVAHHHWMGQQRSRAGVPLLDRMVQPRLWKSELNHPVMAEHVREQLGYALLNVRADLVAGDVRGREWLARDAVDEGGEA